MPPSSTFATFNLFLFSVLLSGVLGGRCARSRMRAFILALTHCHPRLRGSALHPSSPAARPPDPYLNSQETSSVNQYPSFSAPHIRPSTPPQPWADTFAHMRLRWDTVDSMTLDLKETDQNLRDSKKDRNRNHTVDVLDKEEEREIKDK